MHLSQVEEARKLAPVVAHSFSADDTSPALCVQYVPSEGTGGAAATVSLATATGMTFLVDGSAPAGKDAIGASGVVAFATYTTLGAVRDYINGLAAWRCQLRGGLRADASASKLLTISATSCIGDNGLIIYEDTSATDFLSVPISGARFVNNGVNGELTDVGCENSLLNFQINMGVTGNGTVKLYSEGQSETGTELASWVLTDDTLLEKGVYTPADVFFTAEPGDRLILRITAATSIDDYALCDIQGKTAVLDGSRYVREKNY